MTPLQRSLLTHILQFLTIAVVAVGVGVLLERQLGTAERTLRAERDSLRTEVAMLNDLLYQERETFSLTARVWAIRDSLTRRALQASRASLNEALRRNWMAK